MNLKTLTKNLEKYQEARQRDDKLYLLMVKHVIKFVFDIDQHIYGKVKTTIVDGLYREAVRYNGWKIEKMVWKLLAKQKKLLTKP